eukprot:g9122.t1
MASPRDPDDHVGNSFNLLTSAMLAMSAFSFLQACLVPKPWTAVMALVGAVTGISYLLYKEMLSEWDRVKKVEAAARYMDWVVTIPLQLINFYLLLRIATPPSRVAHVTAAVCGRILVAAWAMLAFGYMGETGEI